MATHLVDVSVSSCVGALRTAPDPGPDRLFGAPQDIQPHVAQGVPVRVPDVVLESEVRAVARIKAAGLTPGRRFPGPRPASRRSEVVVRTYPRAGTLVLAGSTVDYELLPGEPRDQRPAGDVDRSIAVARASADTTASRRGPADGAGTSGFDLRGWRVEVRA